MKSRKSCKYYDVCGSEDNCPGCKGYMHKDISPKEATINQTDEAERLKKFLRQPVDLTTKTIKDKASILALHFVGYIAKPTGIYEELYKKCMEAFNDHGGKMEWEEEAILKVLMGDKNGN